MPNREGTRGSEDVFMIKSCVFCGGKIEGQRPDSFMRQLTRASYVFTCPECGRKWTSELPIPTIYDDFSMAIEDVFDIEERGAVITGPIYSGEIRLNDRIIIRSINSGKVLNGLVFGVEMFRKLLDSGEIGDNVGLLIKGINAEDVLRILPDHAYADYGQGDSIIVNAIRHTLQFTEACQSLEDEFESGMTQAEEDYRTEFRACLESSGNISASERRLLDKYRKQLGISEERAREIENW